MELDILGEWGAAQQALLKAYTHEIQLYHMGFWGSNGISHMQTSGVHAVLSLAMDLNF